LSPIGFLGAALGILGGVGGMAGSLAGGTLGDRLSAGSPKGHVTLCAVSVLLLLPFHLLTMAIPDIRVALALWFMVVFFQFFYIGRRSKTCRRQARGRSQAQSTSYAAT
jgi:predicted MFS family arabinose efflux permease